MRSVTEREREQSLMRFPDGALDIAMSPFPYQEVGSIPEVPQSQLASCGFPQYGSTPLCNRDRQFSSLYQGITCAINPIANNPSQKLSRACQRNTQYFRPSIVHRTPMLHSRCWPMLWRQSQARSFRTSCRARSSDHSTGRTHSTTSPLTIWASSLETRASSFGMSRLVI